MPIVKLIKTERYEFKTDEEMFKRFPEIKGNQGKYYIGETQFGDGEDQEIFEIHVNVPVVDYKYQCPKCKKNSSEEQWNTIGNEHYGEFYVPISDKFNSGCYYICPCCGNEVNKDEIQKVKE